MQQIPKVDINTASTLLKKTQDKASEITKGQLRVFETGSPVSAILEATALAGSEVITQVNSLAETLETKRLNYFGLERRDGLPASGVINVRLNGLYPDTFLLPVGFRFSSQGVSFQTNADIIIAPYQATGSVTATALTIGVGGNVKQSSPISYSSNIDRVASIVWLEDAKGGLNAETDDEWKQRIYNTLRRRDTLISEPDFEDETTTYLGFGSRAFAIGRLKPDKTSYGNGYVAVFALNADGSVLTDGQISTIGEILNRKAAMALVSVWSMDIVSININCVATVEDESNPYSIGENIKTIISNYLTPGYLPPGETILNKAIEKRVQDVAGVKEGMVSVKINDLAQPLPLPNKWSTAKAGTIEIIVIRNGIEFII